jgi:SAM-dependent methyltransferase
VEPSLFYTGLVADLYGQLKSAAADPEPYARFIAAFGEPVLELGCGDGEPLLELRRRGIDVEGLDSSADMLARCQSAADEMGLEVVLHHQPMETMSLPRHYRSIYLAGPTFNLLADDESGRRALVRIHEHLAPGGSALVPLFVPSATELAQPREVRSPDGAVLRVTAVAEERDETQRHQTTVLRYERVEGDTTTVVERPWVIHWHTQDGFRELAASAGLATSAVLAPDGSPATESAEAFVFLLSAPD